MSDDRLKSDDRIKRPRTKNTVIASHFPTVFMLREYDGADALNRKLEELMLRLERETTNIASHTSNIGGYHSETDLFARPEPELGSLRDLVQQAMDDYVPKFLAAQLPLAAVQPQDASVGMGHQHARRRHQLPACAPGCQGQRRLLRQRASVAVRRLG
jgi:hypothetical protein